MLKLSLSLFFNVSCYAVSVCASPSAQPWNFKIYDPDQKSFVSEEKFYESLASAELIVFGEKHNADAVQNAEAKIIEALVKKKNATGRFTLAWEFLNYSDQREIDKTYADLNQGKINETTLLSKLLKNDKMTSYAPIISATKAAKGKLLGVNLPRADKTAILTGGLVAAKAGTVPVNFQIGSDHYRSRFTEAMGGHQGRNFENLFTVQCLTDETMSYHFASETTDFGILITGDFHAAYHDGVVIRLKSKAPSRTIKTVVIIDASDLPASQLLPQTHHVSYGNLADYVLFVNEPKA